MTARVTPLAAVFGGSVFVSRGGSNLVSARVQDRNRHIRSINRIGRRKWYLRSGFTKRSVVENVIYRYKTILGREMKARTSAGQRAEVGIGCGILQTTARLGMPESYRVT